MPKTNSNKITGVLHQEASKAKYQLRRYFPSPSLETMVEQFWFVNWDMPANSIHIQQNLPDPNFHLIFEGDQAYILGPVSKKFDYTMKNKSGIVGVKFTLGALAGLLQHDAAHYIDKKINVEDLIKLDLQSIVSEIATSKDDVSTVELLQILLLPYKKAQPSAVCKVQNLVSLIKENPDITSVEQLSTLSKISPRTIQRYFKSYLGLPPKWLIRKYRFHQAIESIDSGKASILDITAALGYADQSHLIRDFKLFTGKTPKVYQEHP